MAPRKLEKKSVPIVDAIDDSSLRVLLKNELEKRRLVNSKYSLRTFASDLGISVAAMSEAMAGKRSLSKKNLLKVAEGLQLKAAVTNRLLNSKGFRSDPESEKHEFRVANDDLIAVIRDWYFVAILNLAKLNIEANAGTIGKRLGITKDQAQTALKTLEGLGLVTITKGTLRRTSRTLMTPEGEISHVRRDCLRQHLILAEKSLDIVPLDERSFSLAVIPADPKNLAQAKNLVEEFRRKAARILESGLPSRVYAIAIQVFPLSDIGRKV